jgi:hypothetical protein
VRWGSSGTAANSAAFQMAYKRSTNGFLSARVMSALGSHPCNQGHVFRRKKARLPQHLVRNFVHTPQARETFVRPSVHVGSCPLVYEGRANL